MVTLGTCVIFIWTKKTENLRVYPRPPLTQTKSRKQERKKKRNSTGNYTKKNQHRKQKESRSLSNPPPPCLSEEKIETHQHNTTILPIYVRVSAGFRELDKAAQDIANEAIIVGEGGDGGLSAAEEAAEAERRIPRVNLGKVVFRGEKFFWR